MAKKAVPDHNIHKDTILSIVEQAGPAGLDVWEVSICLRNRIGIAIHPETLSTTLSKYVKDGFIYKSSKDLHGWYLRDYEIKNQKPKVIWVHRLHFSEHVPGVDVEVQADPNTREERKQARQAKKAAA